MMLQAAISYLLYPVCNIYATANKIDSMSQHPRARIAFKIVRAMRWRCFFIFIFSFCSFPDTLPFKEIYFILLPFFRAL